MDSKTAAAVDEKEVLWRVNYEECLRRLRHQVHALLYLAIIIYMDIPAIVVYMDIPSIIVYIERYILSCLMSLGFVGRHVLTWLKRGSTQELL